MTESNKPSSKAMSDWYAQSLAKSFPHPAWSLFIRRWDSDFVSLQHACSYLRYSSEEGTQRVMGAKVHLTKELASESFNSFV